MSYQSLWPHQEKALAMTRESLRRHRRVILQMPTGAGKTRVATEMILRAVESGRRVDFFVDRLALIDQTLRVLDHHGVPAGVVQGRHDRTDGRQPVQIISIQTFEARQAEFTRPIQFGIIDEAHGMRISLIGLMQKFNRVPFVGLSATPWAKGLARVWEDLVIPVTIRELIDGDEHKPDGYLVDAVVYGPSSPDMTGVACVRGDFNQKQMDQRMGDLKLIASIKDTWMEHGRGKPTILVASSRRRSQQLVDTFRLAGVRAEHIDGFTPTEVRQAYFQGFENREIDMLSSVGVLHVGVDLPIAECLILGIATRSRIKFIQSVGRVIRCHPGKDKALILDHGGNYARLGYHDDPPPEELLDGERQESDPGLRPQPNPKACPQCGLMRRPPLHLPCECGHKPVKNAPATAEGMEEEEGELVAYQRAKDQERPSAATRRNRATSWDDKCRFIGELRDYAQRHRYKSGWVNHMYKEYFGRWPNDRRLKAQPPVACSDHTSTIINNRMKRRAITYSKSNKAWHTS